MSSTRSIKVLFIASNLMAGGIQRQLVYLMKGLMERGITVSLLVLDPVGEFVDEIPGGIKVYCPKSSKPKKQPLRGVWKLKEIIKVVRAEKPDVLYSRHWPTKVPTAFAGRLLKKNVVFSDGDGLTSWTGVSRMNSYLRNIAFRLADVIVAVSQGVANDFERFSKVKVIHNGLDLEGIEKKSREEVLHPWFNETEPIVVAVGRLVSQKAFSYLLEAVKLVNKKIPLRLLMIGDGEFKGDLKKQAEELGIRDKVDFIGVKKNPFAYMARCDLFVLSSLYEGFPNVLVEAMALGLPVISTNCPHGPSEIIEDGRSGILVPVENSQAIAEAMLRVLGDRGLREKLKVEAKRRVSDFSLETMVSKYTDLFLNLSGKI
jgi:glycosyltransferase involved in cell wall biosynthesis